jgi:hypothetical protein
MAEQERQLVKDVQRLRRERNRIRDEHDREGKKRLRMKAQNKAAAEAGTPRPFDRSEIAAQTRKVKALSQRANVVRDKLERAEHALDKFRAEHSPSRRLAEKILESPNSRFDFVSPTGGNARHGLEAIAAGHKAPVAATGVPSNVSESLLRGLAAMGDAGVVLINCLTNGRHSTGSNHYKGKAVDLDLTSPLGAHAIEAIAKEHGGRRNFESDHIHLDFL